MKFKYSDGLELSEEQIMVWLRQEETLSFIAELNKEKDTIELLLVSRDTLHVT